MTSSMRGPGIFLAQFAADTAPFNSLASIAGWAATLGYAGVQIFRPGIVACSISIAPPTATRIATRSRARWHKRASR